jgi:hypothetical protein
MVMAAGPDRDLMIAKARYLLTQAGSGFELAKLVYRALFDYASYTAIDIEPGGPHRILQDLNEPFDLGTRYDICINNGTSEHVFNQANVFKAMHDHTRAGGIMMHYTPCLGWTDHGLFNAQPRMYFELAGANDYEMCLACLATETNLHSMVPGTITDALLQQHPDLREAEACVILRKRSNQPFIFPMQGQYQHLRVDSNSRATAQRPTEADAG